MRKLLAILLLLSSFTSKAQTGPTLVLDNDTTIIDPAHSYTFDGIKVIPTGGNSFMAGSSTVIWTLLSKPPRSSAYWGGPQYQLNGKVLNNIKAYGNYVVTLKVTQSNGGSTTDTFIITKRASTHSPPAANAGADQSLASGTTSTTLRGSGTDTDGPIASYLWTTTSKATITRPDGATTTVAGLADGNTYGFTLKVRDNRGASGTDEMNVMVRSVADTADYKIPLNVRGRFWNGDTVFYQFTDITAAGIAESLIDEQRADPLRGINTPAKTKYWTGYPTSAQYPNPVVIDLGGYYKITHVDLYSNGNYAYLDVIAGTPLHFTDTSVLHPSGRGWVDTKDTLYTRYLKVQYDVSNGGNEQINGMILYGHMVKDSLSRIAPAETYANRHKLKMADFMGCNIWGGIPFDIIDPVGHAKREYVNQTYIDTSICQHNIDSVKFVFDRYSAAEPYYTKIYNFPELEPKDTILSPNPLQDYLRHALGIGNTWFFALEGPASYASNYRYGYDIDKTEHPVRDSVDARQYDRLSRMGWTIAAMFGNKKYPADSMQVTYPSPDSSGMGIMKYIETGNEMNATWGRPYQYYSPEMFEAYSSAIYDGNDETMGSRMGIKTADASMKVVMAGMAGVHPEILKSFYYYSHYKRPDRKLPVDVINFHDYPAAPSRISPEDSKPLQLFGTIDSVAHEICHGCEIWLTEWGYARNSKSKNSVAAVPGKDSAQVQADWVARYWFLLSLTDITRATYYQIRNEPSRHNLDSAATGPYSSMGLTDGNNNSYYAFPVYYYVHTIFEKLGGYKEDSLLYYNHDSLYVIRYRSVANPDSVSYVLWSGTQTNRSVDSFAIKTGHALTPVTLVKLADKQMSGDQTRPTTQPDGTLNLTISETPQMLFTTDAAGGGELVRRRQTKGSLFSFPSANQPSLSKL